MKIPFLSRTKVIRDNGETSKTKSKSREWFDALLFAVIAATVIRGLLFSAYAVPTGSMEGTILTGDYMFVSKISYGPRMPITPISVPFLESRIGESKFKTYWDGIQLPYFRLPGLGSVERGDVVVFNYPPDARNSIDMRIHYVKRCLGLPGDIISMVNAQAFINDEIFRNAPKAQTSFLVKTDGNSINPELLKDLNIEVFQQINATDYVMIIPSSSYMDFSSRQNIRSIIEVISPEGVYEEGIFPQNRIYNWNRDNFGPITIPKKGWTVTLNDSTTAIYKIAIEVYENNKVEVFEGDIFINGKKSNSYTFKMDYYWMVGDNRHNSEDSRYWGFVPEDHIVGKAMVTWLNMDNSAPLWNRVRWDRVLRPVK